MDFEKNNSPKPLFDIKNFLPEGILPSQNGILSKEKLQKVHCGGRLYLDAARSWLAMVRAAAKDNVFLNLNHPFNAYRSITTQIKTFKNIFSEVTTGDIDPSDESIRVEFQDKIWQLNTGKRFINTPGQDSHGFGLAIFIRNAGNRNVKPWLEENAAQFGFAKEYDFEQGHYAYVKSREQIPERVLEIEKISEPKFSAEQITSATECEWFSSPPKDWFCNGVFYSEPFRPGYLAVLDQGSGTGISEKLLEKAFRQCAGIICTNPEGLEKYKRPILLTLNPQETIKKLNALFESLAGEDSSAVTEAKVDSSYLQPNSELYKDMDPEAAIFQKKKFLAERLLKISVKDLQNASKQPWYGEYLALLAITFQNPKLRSESEKYTEELLQQYKKNITASERELAVLAMLQFINPLKFPMPFNQHLWSKEMIFDVQGIFFGHCTKVSYLDNEILNYYLSRQAVWKHGKRKMRVAFLVQSSSVTFDKMQPVYEALRERDDTETFIVLYPRDNYEHSDKGRRFFKEKYPNDLIFDSCSLIDLKRLNPDYVFYGTPYEERCPFPSFSPNDVVQFAKICHITYASLLAHSFIDQLLGRCWRFYRKLYFSFACAETAKNRAIEISKENVDRGYQHFEFLGYPVVEKYYQMPATESSVKRILWTPRWSYHERIGGSHFMDYKDKFLELGSRYGKRVELTMRPHMNTFKTMEEAGLMTREEINAYKRNLKANGIILDSSYRDISETIRNTDIFFADYSSILIEIFLTGRPIIYCEFPNAIPLPEYEEMFASMYIAHSWEEARRYLDDLVAGNDPLFEKRQVAAKNLYELHKDSTKRIVERLLQDFKDSQESDK